MKPKIFPIIKDTDFDLFSVLSELEKLKINSDIEIWQDSNDDIPFIIFKSPTDFFRLFTESEIGEEIQEIFENKKELTCIDLSNNIFSIPYIEHDISLKRFNVLVEESMFSYYPEEFKFEYKTEDYGVQETYLPGLDWIWKGGTRHKNMKLFQAAFYLRNLDILDPPSEYFTGNKHPFMKSIDSMIAKYKIEDRRDFNNFISDPKQYQEDHGNNPPRGIAWKDSEDNFGLYVDYKSFLFSKNLYPKGKIVGVNCKNGKNLFLNTYDLSAGYGASFLIISENNPNIAFYYDNNFNSRTKSFLLFNESGIEVPKRRGKETSQHYSWRPKDEDVIFRENIILRELTLSLYPNKDEIINFNDFVYKLFDLPNPL